MTTVDIVLGIVLVVLSVFLIVAVLMQHGKAHNLSGTIAGGAETFFGKSKGQTIDKKLSTATTVIAVIFVIVVLAVYLMQDSTDTSGLHSSYEGETTTVTTTEVVTGTETAEVTTAATEAAVETATAEVTTAA
ncbi:MAG: preprotein translocase subunit SecG [Clostridia bacterium]|nr:preprotein translocase subunit SecG [Clostridia bacterium]